MGDGVYRTLKAVFFDPQARLLVQANSGEKLSYKTVSVGVSKDQGGETVFDLSRFVVPDFCHFTPQEVMEKATKSAR